MSKKITDDDLDLLDELGVDAEVSASGGRSAREQRIMAGFEDIERFFAEHSRLPQHGEHLDIFERLYAVRLDQIRSSAECREVLAGLDKHGLLGSEPIPSTSMEVSDEELLSSLGVAEPIEKDVQALVHVRSREEIKAAEEIAQRNTCEDFEKFKPLFDKVALELANGARVSRQIRKEGGFLKTDIKQGEFFIVGGQTAYIEEVGEPIKAPNGESDARLRVIYSNGTESNILLRSLQRALYKDPASRRITEMDFGPLFSGEVDEEDSPSGEIYVLRSKSAHPFVAEHRNVIHKIGLTGRNVKARIANAPKEPTFLLAEVEIIATYKLSNINRNKLEALIHKFFNKARLDVELKDRFGFQVEPREWFLVPFPVIEQFIEKLKDGTIADSYYEPQSAKIVKL